jgi:hypothetical protein
MSMEVVHAALQIAHNEKYKIVIGGGEPTLHPQFSEILTATRCANTSGTAIVVKTNGTNEKLSLWLARMDQRIVTAVLSADQFHDLGAVPESVQREFKLLEIARNGGKPIKWRRITVIANQGRARDNGLSTHPERRVCLGSGSGLHIFPGGRIYGCTCDDAPFFGSVQGIYDIPDWWLDGECSFVAFHQNLFDASGRDWWARSSPGYASPVDRRSTASTLKS